MATYLEQTGAEVQEILNRPEIQKVSQLQNDRGYINEEHDPTVPQWSKQPNKPTYTAEEVGAMPADAAFKTINGESVKGSGNINTDSIDIQNSPRRAVGDDIFDEYFGVSAFDLLNRGICGFSGDAEENYQYIYYKVSGSFPLEDIGDGPTVVFDNGTTRTTIYTRDEEGTIYIDRLFDEPSKVELQQSLTPGSSTEAPSVNAVKNRIEPIEEKIPAEASSSNKLADKAYVDGKVAVVDEKVGDIEDIIPDQATPLNKLADKAFVNSSVQTATANFRGNWETIDDVPVRANEYPADYAEGHTPTVNDYLVVREMNQIQEWTYGETYSTGAVVMYQDYAYICIYEDELGAFTSFIPPDEETDKWQQWLFWEQLEGTWRFKYTGNWDTMGKAGWLPEYQVNETPLTAAQLAAINSGITSSKVAKLDAMPASVPVEGGTGANSAQQRGTGASALSVASFAEGAETLAGGKGYKWTRLLAEIGTNFVRGVLLNEEPKGWYKNDIVSIKNGDIYSNIGIIRDIFNSASLGGWVVQFSSVLSITTDIIEDTSEDAQTIWVSKSPVAGNVDLAKAAHAEGQGTVASRDYAHAEGKNTGAYGKMSHAEGYKTEAYYSAHAEGYITIALGNSSHAEGNHTYANGINSHTEGSNTRADGTNAHAENYYTRADGDYSHAEGSSGTSLGVASHVEGMSDNTAASQGVTVNSTDAEIISAYENNKFSLAKGNGAHAEGENGLALGGSSHVEGACTQALNKSEHAEGSYNKSNKSSNTYGDSGNTQHSVGIGTSDNDRKNAVEIMENGDAYIKGVGTYDGTNPTSGTNDVATVIAGKQATLVSGTNIKTVNGNSLLGSGNLPLLNQSLNEIEITNVEHGVIYQAFVGGPSLICAELGLDESLSFSVFNPSTYPCELDLYASRDDPEASVFITMEPFEWMEINGSNVGGSIDWDVVYRSSVTKEVFVATFGSTTAAEILAARTAGKEVIMMDSYGLTYYLCNTASYPYFFFAIKQTTLYYAWVGRDDTWLNNTKELQITGNLVTTIDSSSDNNHYPGAKAVADYVQTAIFGAMSNSY